jgi:methylated-DNA-protein-cysteine methyltransferase related protein
MDQHELPRNEQSAFNALVWKLAKQIPAGVVSSYGQIAAYIPKPASVTPEDYRAFRAQWAGRAMSACPADVPWQRVVNAQGKISPRQGAELQHKLLESEGVQFDVRQRIDLTVYGWSGPTKEWLAENHLVVPE